VFVRCGLKVGLSDEDTTRCLIPTHHAIGRRNKKSFTREASVPAERFLDLRNKYFSSHLILCLCVFLCPFLCCDEERYGIVLFLESVDSLTLNSG
jgi:hypothetical protein